MHEWFILEKPEALFCVQSYARQRRKSDTNN
jgi:hypothetical protein